MMGTCVCIIGCPDLGDFPITDLEQLALEGKFVQDAMRIFEQGRSPCTS